MREHNSKGSTLSYSAVSLSAFMEKTLSAYAHAATAAGVGLLALAQPAGARIVYTRTHTAIPVNGGPVPLDLNHDRVADFSFSNRSPCHPSSSCYAIVGSATVAPANAFNAIWGRGTFTFFYRRFDSAGAIRRGFKVGPNRPYFPEGARELMGLYFYWSDSGTHSKATYGQWMQTKGRYLGLQFLIDGQFHYGWARLQVSGPKKGGLDVTLTGYAYETISNKPIVAGQTKGAEIVDEPSQPISQTAPPATLGMLALGFPRYRFGREMKRSLVPKIRANNQITSGGK